MGMQLFGADYYKNVCEKWACDMPRWNFTDFFHRWERVLNDSSFVINDFRVVFWEKF